MTAADFSGDSPVAGTRKAARTPYARLALAGAALVLIAGCDQALDFDLRGNFGNAMSTSDAAQRASANRPRPDNRGIISYPGYQVAVARRGDTVQGLSSRIGADAGAIARYNGLRPDDRLRDGEVIALPSRVAEPSPATGAAVSGPIQPPAPVDITTLAGGAIDRAQPQGGPTAAVPTAAQPTRHKVARGETAYTVARLYNVSVRSLADWNGLGPDYALREGQFLLIPVPDARAPVRPAPSAATTAPGTGSPTPTPPSAARPLPGDATPAATAAAAPVTAAPNLGGTQTRPAGTGALIFPVQGKIIREYVKGKTDGIDIQAAAGTAIKAAAGGTVAAITADANQMPIVVIRHPDNLLSVYANLDAVAVKRGDTVSQGQAIARMRGGSENYLHFEVRQGFDSVDPMRYLR